MSDGNFNRNLLPYQNYQSGLRAGRASMRTLAFETLQEILQAENIDSQLAERLMQSFRTALGQR
ncbi:MAG: hypothetical protein SOY99_07450 [Alloprevotella sp.]|nr:hypothetical protein [Bacteroidales bacterium]MDY3944044.1 hypothetical protein [Alloprevotella sp.]